MANPKHSTIKPRPVASLLPLLWEVALAWRLYLWQTLRRHWRVILLRGTVSVPVLMVLWLFVSVDVSFNDRQTIAQRAQSLGGLGLTPYFVYSHTPPLQTMADAAALRHGVDPMLFRALITQESQWNSSAVSAVGAAGLTQLMAETAQGECGLSPEDRFDAAKNLDCGARYLAKQLYRFGTVDLALAAYNSGPDRVAKLGRVPRIAETQNYVTRIMASWSGGA